MAKAVKQHTLKLTDKQLEKLTRLVGNHTAGSDRDMFGVYEKLCTLYQKQWPDRKATDTIPGTRGTDANGDHYAGIIQLEG